MRWMKFANRIGRLEWMVGAALLWAAGLSSGASAQTLTPLASFDGSNGASPDAGLIADAQGNLFGTTQEGGAHGAGTVFEIACTAPSTVCTSYASAPTTLYSFCAQTGCTDGAIPVAGLIADAAGNLFGTTQEGGANGAGTVFEIACNSFATVCTSYASTPTILVSFNGANGAQPGAALIADAAGNLFGTTSAGGAHANGTVFELACNSFATVCTGYASAPTTLYSFCPQAGCTDGAAPVAALIADTAGNLFGTTESGGAHGGGTVFELKTDSSSTTGYAAGATTLYSFCAQAGCTDGAVPFAGLSADAAGNLFGTTLEGGANGAGTVFEIACSSFSTVCTGYTTPPAVLVSFKGSDGAFPAARLIADAGGNLFGTAYAGGANGAGAVFVIACNSFSRVCTGYASTPTTLYSFCAPTSCTDGKAPLAALIADAGGNLFGTTSDGTGDYGTVFALAGSGFVPPVLFAGIPGTPSCVGASISTLARVYGGIAHAAAGLGYAGATDLQHAVATFCGG